RRSGKRANTARATALPAFSINTEPGTPPAIARWSAARISSAFRTGITKRNLTWVRAQPENEQQQRAHREAIEGERTVRLRAHVAEQQADRQEAEQRGGGHADPDGAARARGRD